MIELAEKAMAATGARMGRKPLGESADDTKKTHVRLDPSMHASIHRVRGKRSLAAYIREAVAEKLERENKP